MENTIIIKEDRNVINKFRNWYKEKLIKTGKAENFEEKLNKKLELEKKYIKIIGGIATIVLIFCPADGPVGELCAIAATPLLVKLVDLKGKIVKNVIIGGKRKLEADFIKEDGSSKKIEIPEFNLESLTYDFKNIKNTTTEFSEKFNRGRKK